MPIVRHAYAGAAVAWVATLPFATYAATSVHASALTHAFAFAVYLLGSLVCHQKPERSFHLWAAQLPVCARCTGIYVGAAMAVLGVMVAQPFRAARADARVVLFVCAIPTIATLAFEWTTGVMPSNTIRFAAGLPLGVMVSWLVLSHPAQVN